jgi:hypothetical protein
MLYRAIDGAVKRGQCDPSWNPLRFGATGRPAPLSAPADIYLVQGVLMEHRSKPMNPPLGVYAEHQTCVLMMSQSAGRALLDELDKRNEEGNYLYPDIVDLDAGAFIDLHQSGTPAVGQAAAAGPANAPMLGSGASVIGGGGVAQGSDMSSNRYECTILDNYNRVPASLEQAKGVIMPKIKAWDDVVRHFTIEEQISMICSAGLPATAVVHALQESYGDHIPEHVYEQARASQSQPAYYQPGQQQQPAPPAQQPQGFGPPQPNAAHQQPVPPQQPAQAPAGPPALGAGQPLPPTQTEPILAPGVPQAGVQPEAPTQPPAAPPNGGAPSQQPSEAATATPPGFDPQPTHAEPAAAGNTLAALEAARARMRQAGGGQSG